MDSDEEDNDIILLLLVLSSVTNLFSTLPRSRRQLVLVKPWLQCRSAKTVYHNIISELKTTRLAGRLLQRARFCTWAHVANHWATRSFY